MTLRSSVVAGFALAAAVGCGEGGPREDPPSPPTPAGACGGASAVFSTELGAALNRALTPRPGARVSMVPVRCDTVLEWVALEGRCDAADRATLLGSDQSRAARRDDDDQYTVPVSLRGSRFPQEPARSFTFVRVRSDADWSVDDLDNLLGTAATGVCVLASGPLKNPRLGNALGYAIRVQDPTGRRCRGYVSATVAGEFDTERY